MNNLPSEQLHFPNVNLLMKISLGLIFFTMISTVLVYAETTDDVPIVNIVENAYLQTGLTYLDNSSFSVTPEMAVTIINTDTVSHKFISGSSNQSHQSSNTHYTDYLICELGESNNICDFTKDDRIITTVILPGESISIDILDIGTYRLIDPDYPWIELQMNSFPKSQTISDTIEEEIIETPQVIEVINTASSSYAQTISISVDGISYDVEYSTNHVMINEITAEYEPSIDYAGLIINVEVTENIGTLDFIFDRTFFDSIFDGVDDDFFILADGDEVNFTETITAQNRSLSIELSSGTEDVEIIGTVFGNLVLMPDPIIEESIDVSPENIPTQCGPGTVLRNGICVLDERCGSGTVLQDGVCVIEQSSPETSTKGFSKELIIGVAVSIVIAGAIGIILGLISKASKKSN